MAFKPLNGLGARYLREQFLPYIPAQSLGFAEGRLLCVPKLRVKHVDSLVQLVATLPFFWHWDKTYLYLVLMKIMAWSSTLQFILFFLFWVLNWFDYLIKVFKSDQNLLMWFHWSRLVLKFICIWWARNISINKETKGKPLPAEATRWTHKKGLLPMILADSRTNFHQSCSQLLTLTALWKDVGTSLQTGFWIVGTFVGWMVLLFNLGMSVSCLEFYLFLSSKAE